MRSRPWDKNNLFPLESCSAYGDLGVAKDVPSCTPSMIEGTFRVSKYRTDWTRRRYLAEIKSVLRLALKAPSKDIGSVQSLLKQSLRIVLVPI